MHILHVFYLKNITLFSVNFCNEIDNNAKVLEKNADIYKCIIIRIKDINLMANWKKQNTYVPQIQYKKFNADSISDGYNILYSAKKSEQEQKDERLEGFKKRLEQFKNVYTLEDAKELLNRTMPIALDRTTFFIGNAKVVIVNYEKRLRICLDSQKEFICYDFV